MRYSVWPDGSAPVYLDPTDKEIVELAKQRVDTLRICEGEDGRIALASGYGNTHSSVMKAVFQMLSTKRWYATDLILYKEDHSWKWNHLDHWPVSRESLTLEDSYAFLSSKLKELVKLFVQLSGDFHS